MNTPFHPAARLCVEKYLATCAASMTGPACRRREIIVELRDGLRECVAAHEAAGMSPSRAADAALVEFGDPTQVAAGFATELAAAHARRVVVGLIGTGPVVGSLWLAALVVSPTSGVVGLPPWHHSLIGGWLAALLVAGVVILFLATALVVLASTGKPSRWLRPQSTLAPTAATAATIICMTCDVLVLGIFSGLAMAAPQSLAKAPACVAAMASLIRIAATSRQTRRFLQLRSTLA